MFLELLLKRKKKIYKYKNGKYIDNEDDEYQLEEEIMKFACEIIEKKLSSKKIEEVKKQEVISIKKAAKTFINLMKHLKLKK